MSGLRLPAMRQQLIDAGIRVARKPLEDVAQLCPWIEPVELGRLHQAHDDRCALAGQFAAAEEPCLPAHRDHRVILPMSGEKLKSSIAGTRCMGGASGANTASSAPTAK